MSSPDTADAFMACSQPVLANLVVQRGLGRCQGLGRARQAALVAAQGFGDQGALEGLDRG